jgi:hypothetical protein
MRLRHSRASKCRYSLGVALILSAPIPAPNREVHSGHHEHSRRRDRRRQRSHKATVRPAAVGDGSPVRKISLSPRGGSRPGGSAPSSLHGRRRAPTRWRGRPAGFHCARYPGGRRSWAPSRSIRAKRHRRNVRPYFSVRLAPGLRYEFRIGVIVVHWTPYGASRQRRYSDTQ